MPDAMRSQYPQPLDEGRTCCEKAEGVNSRGNPDTREELYAVAKREGVKL